MTRLIAGLTRIHVGRLLRLDDLEQWVSQTSFWYLSRDVKHELDIITEHDARTTWNQYEPPDW
jgi:hypothetical protein